MTDFSDVNISEKAYENFTHTMNMQETVTKFEKSLPLNELFIHIDGDYVDDYPGSENYFPIEGIFKGDAGQTVLHVTLTSQEPSTDENMDMSAAFLKAQLDLFPSVSDTSLHRNSDNNLDVMCNLEDGVQTTDRFDSLIQFIGYSICDFQIVDGNIKQLTFGYNSDQPYTEEFVDLFRKDKMKLLSKNTFYNMDPVQLPCGHEGKTEIMMIKNIRENMIQHFEPVAVNNFDCHKIDVQDTENGIFEISEFPDGITEVESDRGGFIPIDMQYGFVCGKCDTIYVISDDLKEPDVVSETITINTDKDDYTFSLLMEPYRDNFYEP